MRVAMIATFAAACGSSPAAPPASAPDRSAILAGARHVTCSGYPARIGANLDSRTDAHALTGSASDNYDHADFRSCVVSPSDIRCAGTWVAGGAADLRVLVQPNGTFMAEIRGPVSGQVVMSCVVND